MVSLGQRSAKGVKAKTFGLKVAYCALDTSSKESPSITPRSMSLSGVKIHLSRLWQSLTDQDFRLIVVQEQAWSLALSAYVISESCLHSFESTFRSSLPGRSLAQVAVGVAVVDLKLYQSFWIDAASSRLAMIVSKR